MARSATLDMTQGSLGRQIIGFSLPLMFTNLLQMLFSMVDLAVVGRFSSSAAMGSVGSTTTLIFLFTGFLMGLGWWTRSNAEICLLAVKGKPKRKSASVRQLIFAPVEQHSKKPDVVRDRIVELMGDLPRIELFARQTAPGWDVWGNEVNSSISFP